MGHMTPVNGTGSEIVTCLLKYMENNKFDMSIGCNGTATTLDEKNGVIRNIEIKVQDNGSSAFYILMNYYSNIYFNVLMMKPQAQHHFLETGKILPVCEKLTSVNFEKTNLMKLQRMT